MKDQIAIIRGIIFRLRCSLSRKNVYIGPNLKIYSKLQIRGSGKIEIGKNCLIGHMLGDISQHVTLYTHDRQAIIKIGNGAKLYAARISARFAVTIGDDVLIEEAGMADTNFHSIDKERNPLLGETRVKCAIFIGNRVSIGSRSIVGKGVHIGDDTVVGPGSIVSKSLPAECFALGNPARVVSMVKREES